MTTIVFETATFADAIKQAAKVAPSKGNAFDKAAGIVIEYSSDTNTVTVRCTDLRIFRTEWLDFVSAEGPSATWRIPSALFAQVVGTLAIGSGQQVILQDVTSDKGHTQLTLSANRTRAKFNLMETDHYPLWYPFDPANLIRAENLGGRIAQVEWAAAKSDATPTIEGVHFDGERALATDRYRLACAALSIPDLPAPVTVPAGILGSILKQTGEVKIGVTEHQLLIMPDDATQICAILYDGDYPNVDRIMRRDYPNTIKVRKAPLLEVMSRAAGFAGNDRFPALKCFFGAEEIAFMMNNEEIGLLGDVVEVPGFATHARREIVFTAKNFVDAVANCPNEELEIFYDAEKMQQIMYINGGSGFECWIVPRQQG